MTPSRKVAPYMLVAERTDAGTQAVSGWPDDSDLVALVICDRGQTHAWMNTDLPTGGIKCRVRGWIERRVRLHVAYAALYLGDLGTL